MPTTAYHKSTSWLLFLVATLCVTSSVNAVTVSFPSETHKPETIQHPDPTGNVVLVGDQPLFFDLRDVKPPPECSFACAGYNSDDYPNSRDTCSSKEVEEGGDVALIKCLCSDRPFLHHILKCGFKTCGPAINDALAFGYNICQVYNVSLPSPDVLMKGVNFTEPESYRLSRTIENVTFGEGMPRPEVGARTDLGDSWMEPEPYATTTLTGHAAMRTATGMVGVALGAIVGGILMA